MPEMGGIEACERIFAEVPEHYQPDTILALTADVSAENREDCLRSGMKEVITKPINRDDLKRALSRYLII
jgi:CheY-like chemotaxis protein